MTCDDATQTRILNALIFHNYLAFAALSLTFVTFVLRVALRRKKECWPTLLKTYIVLGAMKVVAGVRVPAPCPCLGRFWPLRVHGVTARRAGGAHRDDAQHRRLHDRPDDVLPLPGPLRLHRVDLDRTGRFSQVGVV